MLGTVAISMCAQCYADEFEALSQPRLTPDDDEFYFRDVVVPNMCCRCHTYWERTFKVWPIGDFEVTRTVFLSARTLADICSLQGKCQASTMWGTKPANTELQINNLLAAEKEPVYERALLTVGLWAVRDETVLVKRGCCGGSGWLVRNDGTPWRRWHQPEPKHAPEDEDGAGPGTILDAGPPGLSESPADPGRDTDGGRIGGVRPAASPGRESGVPQAESAERVDAQQRSFVDSEPLVGMTVFEPTETAATSGQVAADAPDIGVRQAHARFPQMGDKEVYVFNNDPRNMESSQAMRDKGVGNWDPSIREYSSFKALVKLCKEELFTERAMRKSLMRYETVCRTAMPKKLSEEQKMQWHLDAMNEAEGDGLSYSKFMTSFVKAEASAKPKPRPIANHKEIRLTALARVAWVFEDVMFHAFEQMSIKHRTKSQALCDIAKNLSGMKRGRWCENDLTAFEFGISEPLKNAEAEMLRHIAAYIGVEETGDVLFERVVSDRTKPVVWVMRYKDECGEMRTFKLKLPRAMRESGDRLTSSGNFFQNLLAWVSFLVAPCSMEKAFKCLLNTHGKLMIYVSPRDLKTYQAMLVFEGDDTLGRLEEAVWEPVHDGGLSIAEDFFRRWGWRPKLLWKNTSGYDYARVVGYDILLHNNAAVFEDGELVAAPEMKRLLNTKNWTTSAVTEEQRKTCTRIFASVLAKEFDKCEPFWCFCRGVYEANQGGCVVSDELVREQYLQLHGELPEHGTSEMNNLEFPEFVGSVSGCWQELARVSCGDFTAEEWARCTVTPTVAVHGADLRCHYPKSWIS